MVRGGGGNPAGVPLDSQLANLHAIAGGQVSVDNAPAAQVVHAPGHIQHELQQRLQGQVLGEG